MTVEEQIKIMQDYLDGKPIEYASKGSNEFHKFIANMSWNFQHFDYRVKVEKAIKYRPYTMMEFARELHKHDGFIIVKGESTIDYGFKVVGIASNCIQRMYHNIGVETTYDALCNGYLWSDDLTPCGVKVSD